MGLIPTSAQKIQVWRVFQEAKINETTKDQRAIEFLQEQYLPILIESFLIDQKAQRLSSETISFYQKKLKYFMMYCDGQAVKQVSQFTPDLIRRYLLELSETHNPGGVHACIPCSADFP